MAARRELALREFESLLADFGFDREIALLLGRIEQELGRPASAARRFEQLVEAGAEPPLLSQAHFELGNIRTRQERYEEAIPHYQRAIAANPTLKEAYFNLGTAPRPAGPVHRGRAGRAPRARTRPQRQQGPRGPRSPPCCSPAKTPGSA